MSPADDGLDISLREIRRGEHETNYELVRACTNRGEVQMRYYPVEGATRGCVFVGGIGGGWDSPGRGELYPRLCEELSRRGIAALRVRFRFPTRLEESVLDVLVGLHFLGQQGVERFGLVGHSFGGAVVAQAAANTDGARAVVTLATQSYGADAVASLPRDCAVLCIHGTDDEVLPPECSQQVYQLAREPKYLRVLSGARHNLDEVADDLRRELGDWLELELTEADPRARRRSP